VEVRKEVVEKAIGVVEVAVVEVEEIEGAWLAVAAPVVKARGEPVWTGRGDTTERASGFLKTSSSRLCVWTWAGA